jgi:hypothetical protein
MLQLMSDNRILAANAKFSYLVDNYPSGTASLVLANPENAVAGGVILLGEMGHSDAEIFVITTVNSTTGAITFEDSSAAAATTKQAHAESTKVTFLSYNQIRFYWTAATGTIADESPVFSDTTPLTAYTDLDPSSYYSTYTDSFNDTGFGWFVYLNSKSLDLSQESNPIPYAGFDINTVGTVFAEFDSLLNVNELKLVTVADKFAWFNEGLSNLVNRLNLNNVEFTLSDKQTITIIPGTSEYMLPADFSDLVEVVFNDGKPMDVISSSQVMAYGGYTTKYYVRGRYMGFVPVPTQATTYFYRYRAKGMRVTSMSQYVQLPDNMYTAIKDWMLFRANMKFANPIAATYLTTFNNAIDNFILAAVKRNGANDSWSIDPSANT